MCLYLCTIVKAPFALDLLEVCGAISSILHTMHLCFLEYELFIYFLCRTLLNSFIAVSVYLYVTCIEEKIFVIYYC